MNDTTYDLFAVDPDRGPLWLETVNGLENAERRMELRATESPGVYFIYNTREGAVVARLQQGQYQAGSTASRSLQRNANKCAHCGEGFSPFTETTPIVNRSDGKSFHVTLFFGPAPHLSSSGGYVANQVICTFAYTHDRIGPKNELVGVVVLHAKETNKEVLCQVEEVSDKLAELVESGKILEPVYTFDEGQLIPGLRK